MNKSPSLKIPPSMQAMVNILNFRLAPSSISGVAPVQALSAVERATIAAIQQYPKEDLKQIVRFLAGGNSVYDVFLHVKFPNEPDFALLRRIREEISRSGRTNILIYGVYHELFAWIAADVRQPEFFLLAFELLQGFIPRADPMELHFVATFMANAFLNDSRLILTEAVYTSIINFLCSSRKMGIDFTGVFRLFSIKVLHELPALELPFLKLCEQFMLERRPYLQLSGEDNFVSVLSGLLDSLKLSALQFLTKAGGLPLPIVPEMESLFQALPMGILNFLKSTTLQNGFYEPDQEPSLSLDINPLDCRFITSPRMTYDCSDFVTEL
jgi:hypothetical protein